MATAAAGTTPSDEFRQALQAEIDSQLGGNFALLGSHPNVDNMIIGMICVESGQGLDWRNVDVAHTTVPATSGFGKSYENHQVTKAARANPALNQGNITQGRQAQSLLGCMGAYLIRGLQQGPRGFFHVQQSYYYGIAESAGILVNPGDSITALFPRNKDGLMRGLVAGLCVMESNYRTFLSKTPGDKDKAMRKTIQAHLGDPNAVDVITGINSSTYLDRVLSNAQNYASGRSSRYTGLANNSVKSAKNSGYSRGTAPGCGA